MNDFLDDIAAAVGTKVRVSIGRGRAFAAFTGPLVQGEGVMEGIYSVVAIDGDREACVTFHTEDIRSLRLSDRDQWLIEL